MIRIFFVVLLMIFTFFNYDFAQAKTSQKRKKFNVTFHYVDKFQDDKKFVRLYLSNKNTNKNFNVVMDKVGEGEFLNNHVKMSCFDPINCLEQFSIEEIGNKTHHRFFSFDFWSESDYLLHAEILPPSVSKREVRKNKREQHQESQFQNEKRARVIINSKTEVKNTSYAQGVDFYQAKDFENSKNTFEAFIASSLVKDELLVFYAHYYLANINLKLKSYQQAKNEMIFLSNNPNNPNNPHNLNIPPEMQRNMNQMATILSQKENYQQRLSKKFGGSILLDAFQYDSNVVNLPGSLAPTSNRAGAAVNFQGSGWYYFKLNEHREMSLTYNLFTNVHPEAAFVNYDFWGQIISGRFMNKLEWRGMPVRINTSPGYGLIQGEVTGVRHIPPSKTITNTYFLQNQVAIFLRNDLLLETNLNVKYDINYLPSSVGTDDSSGSGFSLATHFSKFFNDKFARNAGSGISLNWQNSLGANQRQFKPTLSLFYGQRLLYEVEGRLNLSGYQNFYYDSTTHRRDQQVKLDLIFTRYLSKAVLISQSFAVSKNYSNIDLGRYNRFVSTTSLGALF